jgi:nitrogen fixation/metabolism regulation signal transduction histidine kinase
MLRPFVLAFALVLTGAVLAGCGGGIQKSVRQESKQLLRDGHPKILRIQTVRDVGGNRQAVATLEDISSLHPHTVAASSDPAVRAHRSPTSG